MRRRDAIVALGGAAVWPLVARAQQAALPVVGFVSGGSPAPFARNVAAFRQGLKEAGYTEGHNVVVEYRWAEGRYGDLPRLVDDLVRRGVDVIAATGGTSSATAAKEATQSIPIVFLFGGDPVQMGLVASLSRPGGNATGVNMLTGTLNAKRLDFLRELVGATTPIAVLLNPENRSAETQSAAIGEAARILGQQAHFVLARSEAELEGAFRAAREKAGGLLVAADPFDGRESSRRGPVDGPSPGGLKPNGRQPDRARKGVHVGSRGRRSERPDACTPVHRATRVTNQADNKHGR